MMPNFSGWISCGSVCLLTCYILSNFGLDCGVLLREGTVDFEWRSSKGQGWLRLNIGTAWPICLHNSVAFAENCWDICHYTHLQCHTSQHPWHFSELLPTLAPEWSAPLQGSFPLQVWEQISSLEWNWDLVWKKDATLLIEVVDKLYTFLLPSEGHQVFSILMFQCLFLQMIEQSMAVKWTCRTLFGLITLTEASWEHCILKHAKKKLFSDV